MIQPALVHTMCGEQILERGCSLDLGSEYCWALVITTVIALGMATIITVIALGIAMIMVTSSTITAFSLGLRTR